MACPDMTDDAERIRETIRRQSYEGGFFSDNAVRVNGKLQVTTNRTEVCQYFAFYLRRRQAGDLPRAVEPAGQGLRPAAQADQGLPRRPPGQRLHRQRPAAGAALPLRPLPAIAG